MPLSRTAFRSGIRMFLSLAVLALMVGAAFASPKQGTKLGPEDPNKQITVVAWLNLHDKTALDALVEGMYEKGSANYHHFLSPDQFKTQFAPSAEEASTVSSFLAAHNLKVASVDKLNLFVMAQGRVADAQAAFNVQISRRMINGEVHRMNDSEPSIKGPAATLVAAVQGLNDLEYRSHIRPAANPETGAAYPGVPLSSASADGLFFSANCLRPPQLVTFTTGGTFPTAAYFGNRYGADITSPEPNLPPCGYDPANLQGAYGLNKLYNRGLDGTGQTIMIVDAFGSNTIVSDANLFNSLNSLPLFTSSNFATFTPDGPVTCTSTNGCIAGNWQLETTLDVEWAHSIAPGASVALILAPSAELTNLDLGNLFAVENGFGNVLSNSFGIPEIVLADLAPSELVVENDISELAASLGISQQAGTGDSGDNLALDTAAFGIDSVSADAEADSPFATGVGGTSTFLNSNNNIELQTGWGFNFARIADPTPNPPVIPPLFEGFQSGSGGGASVVYAKPSYQKRLPGNFRQTPDIAMNADPNTGVEIVVTPDSVPGDEVDVAVAGGTSLSCPMFTGLWSIANQAAGGGPIGQAAPVLYELPGDAILDVNVTPLETLFDVTGLVLNPPSPPAFESAPFLAQPLENTRFFISALFQSPTSTRWDVFTFGTDSSLTTGPGWDNVTGLGTPNGERFIDEVARAVQQ
jgi:subtilase family serine protease